MPVLYAHRGAAAELPENTLPAFLRALEVGADAIETDVHLTRDGHVVLAHDPTGARAAGEPAAICRSTLAEVRAWNVGRAARGGGKFTVPTLAEALAALPGVPLNVDLKQHDAATAQAVVAAVRAAGATDRVLLTSFDPRTIRRVRRLGYEGRTGLDMIEALQLWALPLAALRRISRKGSVAQLAPRMGYGVFVLDRPEFVAKAHALGIEVHYWTINEPREAERLLALGADAIMTDDPAAIAPVFARLRAPR